MTAPGMSICGAWRSLRRDFGSCGQLWKALDCRRKRDARVRTWGSGSAGWFSCSDGHLCLKPRESPGSEICPLTTPKDYYEIVRDSDKVITV